MNKYFRYRSEIFDSEKGMTLIELLFSVILMTFFVGVLVVNNSILMKYLKINSNNSNNKSDQIIDYYNLNLAMDLYQEFLSQPGILKEEIYSMTKIQNVSMPEGCTLSPSIDWNIYLQSETPDNEGWRLSDVGYALCIKSTSIVESPLSELISNINDPQPGIYVLLALPKVLTPSALPLRRTFCRPSSFC